MEFLGLDNEAIRFYRAVLKVLNLHKIDFLLGGTVAVAKYTGIKRITKDIDFFCKSKDYPNILKILKSHGFKTEVTDRSWIAKALKGKYYADFIFGSIGAMTAVDQDWFTDAPVVKVFGQPVKLIPPLYLIWSKIFVQDRYKFDGADVVHLILKQHHNVDWKKLLVLMEPYWELLLISLLYFRFIYPSERENIPRWLFTDLVKRVSMQTLENQTVEKICRGKILSPSDYKIDTDQWGFK